MDRYDTRLLTLEELGDVLFACRQIARKCLRESKKPNIKHPSIKAANVRRHDSLKSAMDKLHRLFYEGKL